LRQKLKEKRAHIIESVVPCRLLYSKIVSKPDQKLSLVIPLVAAGMSEGCVRGE
jgi:hypothetical protein